MFRTVLLAAAIFAAAPAFAGETAAKAQAPAPVATPAPTAKMATEAQRLDLNSATVEQLTAVRGLNKPLAEAIVKARPFKSVEDLSTRKILSSEAFGTVKDRLIVR